jgi:hypothetical protein
MPLFYTDLKLVLPFSLFNPETKLSEMRNTARYKRGALAGITVGWALPFEKCILTFSKSAPQSPFLIFRRRSAGPPAVTAFFRSFFW